MSVDLTHPCAACQRPLIEHVRADGRVVCRGSVAPTGDAALTIAELGAKLKLAPRTIFAHRRRHDHAGILELPRIGKGHPRFSKRAVDAWLANQPYDPDPPRRRPLLSAHRPMRTSKLRVAKAELRTR